MNMNIPVLKVPDKTNIHFSKRYEYLVEKNNKEINLKSLTFEQLEYRLKEIMNTRFICIFKEKYRFIDR